MSIPAIHAQGLSKSYGGRVQGRVDAPYRDELIARLSLDGALAWSVLIEAAGGFIPAGRWISRYSTT